MDEQRFDVLAKSIAGKTGRRTFLKGMLGMGAGITAGALSFQAVGAARTGTNVMVASPPCVRSCGLDSCGMADGCGGICTICPGGLTCLENGMCGALCNDDDQCASESECANEASGLGICAGDAIEESCVSSIDCPPGTFCMAERGICRLVGSGMPVD